MKNMPMKWKIIIPMSGILTALVITTIVFSTIRFTGYTRILFNERITVATNGFKKYLNDSGRNSRIAALSASTDINIIEAVNNRDKDEIIRLLLNSMDLYHVGFFTVTDEAGIALARTHEQGRYGDSVLDQKCVREALNNNIYTCIEEGTEVKVSVRTGAPMYNSDGVLIGVMSAGVRFDTNDTLDLLKDQYNAEFTTFYKDVRIATTINIDGNRILGSPIHPDVAEYIYTNKEEYYVDVDIMGENYSMFYLPLLNDRGEIFAIVAVGYSNSKLILEKNALQKSVMLIGISGLVISIIMLLIITSRIVKPVRRLASLVSEVTCGNMHVDIDRTGVAKDEIGLLTRDIYSLVGVIQHILNDLSHLTINLNKFGSMDFEIDAGKYSGSYKEIIGGIKKLADSISTMRETMAIMDHLDTMIFVANFDYNLLYVNRNLAEAYGVDRESCIGQKCYKAIRHLDQPCDICQLQKLLPDKDAYPSIDYDSLFDESSDTYIGGRMAIIRWVDGAQVIFNSFRDETLKIEYQEQLRGAMADAEAASVAKSAFLANMSHEIRTPMNSIIGFSELALDREMTPITREYLGLIQENTKWLLQIINDILDISKVESGNIELENIPFDLRELLNSCRSVILPRAVEKNISLEFYTESSICKKMLGDPTKLRQVMLNMLSNAVKFTDSGSVKLSVSVKNKTEDKITLWFEIKDSGIGMTGDQIKRIFEPFMQADISTTRKYGGTGLGMSITKNILDLMGSKLEIKSEPGVGTTISFELTFDIADTTDAPDGMIEEAGTELDKPTFEGEILVCEDNMMNQRVIREHLMRVGLSVEIAENGQEGIDKVRSRIDKGMKPFDLILMDIHMPVMDGIDAAPKIVALGTGTPIVAMTANIMVENREMYQFAGMTDYVGKPFTSQELWRCLLRYLTPVGFTGTSSRLSADKEEEDSRIKLRKELKTDFVKSNQTMSDEIKNAIDANDIKAAHRLAHSLKNSAALIGLAALQEVAAEVEAALKGGESRVTKTQMDVLRNELSAALDDLSPYLDSTTDQVQPEEAAAGFDADKARELIEKLEPLLKSGNPECLKMINDVKAIPGSGELIQQMEDFYFGPAAKTLVRLKNNLEASQ